MFNKPGFLVWKWKIVNRWWFRLDFCCANKCFAISFRSCKHWQSYNSQNSKRFAFLTVFSLSNADNNNGNELIIVMRFGYKWHLFCYAMQSKSAIKINAHFINNHLHFSPTPPSPPQWKWPETWNKSIHFHNRISQHFYHRPNIVHTKIEKKIEKIELRKRITKMTII